MANPKEVEVKRANFYQVTSKVGNYPFIGHMFGKAPVFIPSSLLTDLQLKGLNANKHLDVKGVDKLPETLKKDKKEDKS